MGGKKKVAKTRKSATLKNVKNVKLHLNYLVEFKTKICILNVHRW